MTFSILGRCAKTNMTGVAITTSSIAVGSRCPYAMAGAGAVTTQNVTDPTIGPDVLALMLEGVPASDAVDAVIKTREHAKYRQVAAVDCNGSIGVFTGEKILGTNAINRDIDCVAAGNLLRHEGIPKSMTDSFIANPEVHLAERLITALLAGIEAGGEEGPTHSSAVIVADQHPWPLVDLRVDWTDACPGEHLRDLWHDYAPQMGDYLSRAINPDAAPSYGVPGDA